MHQFLTQIKTLASQNQTKIIFPESSAQIADPRIYQATKQIITENICHPILIGSIDSLKPHINLSELDQTKFTLLNQNDKTLIEKFTEELFNLRKSKGLTLEEAKTLIQNPNYFATLAVHLNLADAMISGATQTTADTIRPALQILKTRPGTSKVSSCFFMLLPNRSPIIFADCAIQIEPTPEDLAEIANETAKTAQLFNITPSIALLSFSTNNSASHPQVDKIRSALTIFKQNHPNFDIIGEIQADAALIPEILNKKFPNNNFKNLPNILIFPSLESGNIAYKLVERLANAEAIGPILQGLNKPVNDLSRGCSATDIVNLAAITAIQTQKNQ